jgi:signal transduction histidine kinase
VLQDLLKANRTILIDRCRNLAVVRTGRFAVRGELQHGVPIFLDHVIKTLDVEEAAGPATSSEPPCVGGGVHSELEDMASLHGRELLDQGFTLEQVVRDYGDVCQAVTNLAIETKAPIEVSEFRTFNRCLDNAIAAAVTEYVQRRGTVGTEGGSRGADARLGHLVHELQKDLQTTTQFVNAIQTDNVGISEAAGRALDRSFSGMRSLTDRALAEVRLSAGAKARLRPLNIATFLGDVTAIAAPNAIAHGCHFAATLPDNDLLVNADAELLSSAVVNLLCAEFKFTKSDSHVRLHAQLVSDRILIEVENDCGGVEERSELGLDLQICRRRVELNNGILSVRNLQGGGYVFTIELPSFTDPAERGDQPIIPLLAGRASENA